MRYASFKTLPWHMFLFAVFPVVLLYARNMEWVAFKQILLPALMMLLLAVASYLLFKIIFKSGPKAALYVSFCFLFFFSHGDLYNLVSNKGHSFRVHYFLAVEIALYVLVFVGIYRLRRDLSKVTQLLNMVAFCLVAFNAVSITTRLNAKPATSAVDMSGFSANGKKPHVYFFMLDMYARADVLKRVHGFDNTPFLNALRGRSFYVADSSHSNYPQTVSTLASMFNYQYLQEPHPIRMRQMIHDNKVLNIFQKLDYNIVAFRNGCAFATLRNVDEQISPSPFFNDINLTLIGTTPLQVLPLNNLYIAPLQRKSVLQPYEYVKSAVNAEAPQLIYVHSICPHPPYLFGPNGEAIPQEGKFWDLNEQMRPDGASPKYINQVRYINKVVTATIDTILKNERNPFAIVIMGDHGSKIKYSTKSFDGNDIPEHMSNLFAVYFSDKDYSTLYPSITPVNVFPTLLNKYFNARIPLQPDNNYFYLNEKDPVFVDVTEILRRSDSTVSR